MPDDFDKYRQPVPNQEMPGVKRVSPAPDDGSSVSDERPSLFKKRAKKGRGGKDGSKEPESPSVRRTRAAGDDGGSSSWDDWDKDSPADTREMLDKDSESEAGRKIEAARKKSKAERGVADGIDKASDAAIESGEGHAMAAGVAGKAVAGGMSEQSKLNEQRAVQNAQLDKELADEQAHSAATDDVVGSIHRQDDLKDKKRSLNASKSGDSAKVAGAAAKGAADGVQTAASGGAADAVGDGAQTGAAGINKNSGQVSDAGGSSDGSGKNDAKSKRRNAAEQDDDGPIDADEWDRENEEDDDDAESDDEDKDEDEKGKDKEKDKDDKSGGLMDKLSGKNDSKGIVGKMADMMKKLMLAIKLAMNIVKQLIMMQIMNMMAMFAAMVANVVASVVAMAVQIATTVATAVGISVAVAATILTGGLFGVVIIAVIAVTSAIESSDVATKDDGGANTDCTVIVSGVSYEGTDLGSQAQMIENGRIVWNTYGPYGLGGSNYAIAGLLGNFQAESGVDATAVQNVMDEPYTMGPIKTQAFQNGGSGVGLGLGQWTGVRHDMLVDYAAAAGRDWYDLYLQLAFAIAPNGDGGAYILKTFLGTSFSSPSEAAEYFCREWEKPADSSVPVARMNNAEGWMGQVALWDSAGGDSSYYESVLAIVGEVVTLDGEGSAAGGSSDKACGVANISANEKAAYAAGLIAYMSQAVSDSKYEPNGSGASTNSPKSLYKSVKDGMYSDTWYASCDRCVCTAVRWSGTDDHFPTGSTTQQLDYMADPEQGGFNGTSGWVNVSDQYDASNFDQIPVGAIMIVNNPGIPTSNDMEGHIVMYTGSAVLNSIYGGKSGFDPNCCIVAASYCERMPGCELMWNRYYEGSSSDIYLHSDGYYHSNTYQIFVWSGPYNWGEESAYTDAGGVGTVEYIYGNKDNSNIVGSDFYT